MMPFVRMALRSLARRWPQTILSVIGIGLGIAVMLAIDISNDSARRAFEFASEGMGGQAEAIILGGPRGLDEDFYRQLRLRHGVRGISPVVEGWAEESATGIALKIVGIDPLALSQPTRQQDARGWSALTELVARPESALMTADAARTLGIEIPGDLELRVGNRRARIAVVGALPVQHEARANALRNVAVMDVGGAQTLLAMPGRLSRIEVHDANDSRRLTALLPPSLRLVPGLSQAQTMRQMTRSFRINLTALSLLAVVIGAFLVYNTMVISVLQRREQIATLRTLGVTRPEILATIMIEALALAAAGMVFGTLFGVWLSHALLQLVTRTINDLYFSLQVTAPAISNWTLAKSNAVGVLAALGAAAAPAWEATRVSPRLAFCRSHLESTTRSWLGRWAAAGLVVWAVAAAILWVSDRSIVAGFAALFCLIAGFALTVPMSMVSLMRGMRRLLSGSPYGRIATGGILASLSRTHVAVTALAVALSATVGVGIMIGSFRTSVNTWLGSYLRADIYVSQGTGRTNDGITPAIIAALRKEPAVRAVTTGRWVRFTEPGRILRLFVVDVDRYSFENFQLRKGEVTQAWQRFNERGAVLVSEAFAYHRGLSVGDSMSLPTRSGTGRFEVAAVFRDYGSDQGTVVMHRRHYERHWDDPVVDSVALYLRPDADSQALLAHLEPGMLKQSGLQARSNRELRELSLAIFDRTFAITGVLRLLTVIIAVVAIVSALAAIQLERAREFAMLRATGVTRRGLAGLLMGEGALMGLAAGILSLPLGLMMSMVLISVINRRSFGWTIDMALSPEHFLTALLLSVAAGLVAAVYPALRMTSALTAEGLRHE